MRLPFCLRIASLILVFTSAVVQKAQARQISVSTVSGVLSTNRDTVLGVYDEFSISKTAIWEPGGTIIVHNNSGSEVVLDSFSLRQDSIFTPLAFFSRKDSVNFQLRAKVMGGAVYHPDSIRRGGKVARIIPFGKGFLTNGSTPTKSNKIGPQFKRNMD